MDQLVAWSGRCTAVLPVELVVRERASVAIFGVDRGTTLAERLRPRKADGLASLTDSAHSETPPIAAVQEARAVAGRLFEALATLHEVGIVHGGLELLFEAALAWVRADRPILPTDAVHALARELAKRVDQKRTRTAWEEAGSERTHVFVGSGDELHRLVALPSAREALMALSTEHRREVVAVLGLLATNQAPRGVEPLGDPMSHLCVQVGEVRVLTCVRDGALVFVALASGWALPACCGLVAP